MLKIGEYDERKEKGYDGDRRNSHASSSTCVVGIWTGDMPSKSNARKGDLKRTQVHPRLHVLC